MPVYITDKVMCISFLVWKIDDRDIVRLKRDNVLNEFSIEMGLTFLAGENNPNQRVFNYPSMATGFRSGMCSATVAPNSSDADCSSGIHSARGPSGITPARFQRRAGAEVTGIRSARPAHGDTPDGTPDMVHLRIPYANSAMEDY